jgi:two-component system cell cycle response regulator
VKAKVLVVEDSKAQREHLVELLTRRGYEVRATGSGLDALREIKDDPVDVVILDVMLDGMDGYSVCRWLRLGESTRDVVVIMLTVKGDVKEKVEGLHVGADDYLPKPFDEDELEARIFASLRSQRARQDLRARNSELEGMLTKTERLAMTDELTGVYNRRRVADMLKREWATARRYRHPLSMLLIDVDRFKTVNDVDGHNAGDETLKNVAALLAVSIREVDVCARYGGDEFALLLPHTPSDKAVVVAERARAKVEQTRSSWPGEAASVSLSIGVSSSEDESLKSADELVEAADRALYEAKRAGRNQVVVARHGILMR